MSKHVDMVVANFKLILDPGTFSLVLPVFGFTAFIFAVTGMVLWMNVALIRRDKKRIGHWLEAQGNRIQTINWVFYPNRMILKPSLQFDATFLDASGRKHHAFIVAPTWGRPEFIEDKLVG